MISNSKFLLLTQGLGSISNSFIPNSSLIIENTTNISNDKNISQEEQNEIIKISKITIEEFKNINIKNTKNKMNIISKFDENEKSEIVSKMIKILEGSNLKNKDKIIKQFKLKKVQDKFFVDANKEYNKQIKIIKEEFSTKKKEEEITRVSVNEKENYYVNLDKNQINSKTLFLKVNELQESIKILDELTNGFVKLDNVMDTIINIIDGAMVACAFGAAVASFATTFSFGTAASLAIGAFQILGSIGLWLGIAKIAATYTKKLLFSMLELTTSLGYKTFKESNISLSDNINAVNFVLNNKWTKNTDWNKKFKNISIDFNKWVSKASQISDALSTIGSIVTLPESIRNFSNDFDEVCQRWAAFRKAKKDIENNSEKIKMLRSKFDWVVLHETEQDKPYNQGGRGGKNKVFKNEKTNEIFTLEELLLFSNAKLKLMRLEKIYSKKTGWYIRTIKNKSLEDNLG